MIANGPTLTPELPLTPVRLSIKTEAPCTASVNIILREGDYCIVVCSLVAMDWIYIVVATAFHYLYSDGAEGSNLQTAQW